MQRAHLFAQLRSRLTTEGFTPTQEGHGHPSFQFPPGFQSNCASRSRSPPLCKWTLDTQKVPHFQIKKKENFQAMHTISVELIVITVIGSCWEVRSQEAEKRNHSFVGLIKIRRVAVRLLKKKKKNPLRARLNFNYKDNPYVQGRWGTNMEFLSIAEF